MMLSHLCASLTNFLSWVQIQRKLAVPFTGLSLLIRHILFFFFSFFFFHLTNIS